MMCRYHGAARDHKTSVVMEGMYSFGAQRRRNFGALRAVVVMCYYKSQHVVLIFVIIAHV